MIRIVSVLLASFSLHAVAATSWVSQPSWSSQESAPKTKSSARSEMVYQVTPFSPGSNNLSLDVGQIFLMGDLGDRYSDNIGLGLHYTHGVSDLFAFDSSLNYSQHSEGMLSMMSLLTGLRTNLSWFDKVVPYATVGLGFYRPSYSLEAGQSLSPVLFGIHLGPGIDLEITKSVYFGAALTFHDIFGSDRSIGNGEKINVGGTFTTFLVHAGVTF